MAQASVLILCSLFAAGALGNANAAVVGRAGGEGVNPIRKIVTLLQDMQKEVEAESKKDKELYEKFMCFCDNGVGGLQKTIADAKATIEDLTAKIEEETSEKAQLGQDVVQHKTDREQATVDLEKATALRSKENSDFEREAADAKTNLAGVSKALPALEAGLSSSSLVQLGGDVTDSVKKAVAGSMAISSSERETVLAFLSGKSSSSETDSSTGPSSGEIVGILKTMKDDMEESVAKLDQAEQVSSKGFEDLKSAKDQEIKLATQAVEQKQKRGGELGVLLAQRSGAVEDAQDEQADAEKFISTLDRECSTKKQEYDNRQKLRTQEIAAISETISILNDDDALDVFKKAVPSALLQDPANKRKHVAGFVQGGELSVEMRLQKAQKILAAAGKSYKSPQLGLIAYSIKGKMRAMASAAKHGSNAGGAVDFSEIIRSIEGMVAVLNSEMKDDEKHKEWCRGEFDKSEREASATQDQVSQLTAGMEEMTDETTSLAEDIKTLQESIATTDKEVSESTEQRKAEHAEYLVCVQMSEAAKQLLEKAKNRMAKFYNPALYVAPAKEELSAEDRIAANLGASFFQKHEVTRHTQGQKLPDAPETMEGSTTAPNKKSGGVLALMDSMAHELEMDHQEAVHDEKTAQSDYVEMMGEMQATRETDGKSVVSKGASKAELEAKLSDSKENRMNTLKGLENVHQYINELHGSCDFIIENFAARKEARASELEGLRNAKSALAGATYF